MNDNLSIIKKNQDGTYCYEEEMFEGVDLYEGDHVFRTFEIAPKDMTRAVRKVKIKLKAEKNGNSYSFVPSTEDSYILESKSHPGIRFYLENSNGIKLYPDSKGTVNIIDILQSPIDVTIHLIADKFTVTDFEKKTVIDDLSLEMWSLDA